MASQEHLDILKQGLQIWDQWREEYPDVQPDLREADLSGFVLKEADLSETNLSGANLNGADLSSATLSDAFLNYAFLIRADLSGARLGGTIFTGANLSKASLMGADLSGTNLNNTFLCGADLSSAMLSDASLNNTDLREITLIGTTLIRTTLSYSSLHQSKIGWTIFADIDLSTVKGLETIKHVGPSTIGMDTILRSEGKIPIIFLQETGISDQFIAYVHALANAPSNYYTCFICNSSKNQEFARQLYTDLQSKGVRCWFAPEDLKIGDHYHQRIDETIRRYDKLILVLSEQSIASVWVEREVAAAREKEDNEQRPVLFPLRLDDAVMHTTKAWAADVRRRWHIGDFTQWKNHDSYQIVFKRLLHDLKTQK
jgi:hypothetical protein